ncbi:MAG TPA: NADH-quinone oxidoreductase subunit N [Solirubrobacterales bacterium]|nr:NADH-quinone oxidoreductase subunit N [Solirubrobacterales bacterium]
MTLLGLELGTLGLLVVVWLLALVQGPERGREAGLVTAVGLAGLLALSVAADPRGALLDGAFVVDPLARLLKQVFVFATLLGVVGGLALPEPAFRRRASEYHLLVLASLLGMLLLASARELTLVFVAFELMSIPLYVLAGFLKRDELAVEAALKFFLVGSLSTALFAYGLSFLYGATGSTRLDEIGRAWGSGDDALLGLGFVLALAGIGFKIAAVPFHMWVPDTYEAASTPFVAWLSVAPKAAGFAVIFRLFVEGTADRGAAWVPFAATLAVLTIVAGNLMALPQDNAKRLLAYSGIAHIGYMLLGVVAQSPDGIAAVLFYLVAYVPANMGAFLVVEAVARSEGSTAIAGFRGLAQRAPLLALTMLLFLLSLGGIPFVVGFWAKLYVFWAVAEAGFYGLVVLGAVLTVVALFYYLLVARQMYIEPPARATPVAVPAALALVLIVSALAVVALGLYPGPLVDSARAAAAPLF